MFMACEGVCWESKYARVSNAHLLLYGMCGPAAPFCCSGMVMCQRSNEMREMCVLVCQNRQTEKNSPNLSMKDSQSLFLLHTPGVGSRK